MLDRPYAFHQIRELEQIFKDNLNNIKVLRKLKNELIFRDRPKALKLKEKIELRISELKEGNYILEQANLFDIPKKKKRMRKKQVTLFEVAASSHSQQNDRSSCAEEKSSSCRQLSFFEKIVQKIKKPFGG